MKSISIRGARGNNLKDIDVDIPLNKITCVAGPSGSGKSSLAYHTLFSESKRRFLNSLSNSEKFFWDTPKSVDVDSISPVLPVWGLPQQNPIMSSRHVVSDMLNITGAFQLILHSIGEQYCPGCGKPLKKKKIATEIEGQYKKLKLNERDVIHIMISYGDYFDHFNGQPPVRGIAESGDVAPFELGMDTVELKRFRYKNIGDLESFLGEFEQKFTQLYTWCSIDKKCREFSDTQVLSCSKCNEKFDTLTDVKELDPGSPVGACQSCEGHGATLEVDYKKIVRDYTLSIRRGAIHLLNYTHFEHYLPPLMRELAKKGYDLDAPFSELSDDVWEVIENPCKNYPGLDSLIEYLESKKYKKSVRIYLRGFKSEFECGDCKGVRLKKESIGKTIILDNKNLSLGEIYSSRVSDLLELIKEVCELYSESKVLSQLILVRDHLQMASDLGLGHLLLKRKAKTLSGSEYQRLLLVKYFGHQGSGGFYILDEPSLGLDENYQKVILSYLEKLKKRDNTILLVEHSSFFQKNCDELILMGPGSGNSGGEVVFQGGPQKLKIKELDVVPEKWNKVSSDDFMRFKNVSGPYLLKKSFKLKKGVLTWVHGDPGSGKTSYMLHGIANSLNYYFNGKFLFDTEVEVESMSNIDDFDDVHYIDSNLGKITSRSTVGTYVGLLPLIRKIFSSTREAKLKGYLDGHFSWNSPLGQCETCEGTGTRVIDLHFLEDLEFVCDSCEGKKIKSGPSEISVGSYSFHEVVNKELSSVIGELDLTAKGKRIYDYMSLLKLSYLSLGRNLNTLSGGERQRLKLFSLLQKNIKNSIIFFENVSFGISKKEIYNYSFVFERLRNDGNTIILIDSANEFSEMSDEELVI